MEEEPKKKQGLSGGTGSAPLAIVVFGIFAVAVLGIVSLVPIVAICIALAQRCREVAGGEEEEAKKY